MGERGVIPILKSGVIASLYINPSCIDDKMDFFLRVLTIIFLESIRYVCTICKYPSWRYLDNFISKSSFPVPVSNENNDIRSRNPVIYT